MIRLVSFSKSEAGYNGKFWRPTKNDGIMISVQTEADYNKATRVFSQQWKPATSLQFQNFWIFQEQFRKMFNRLVKKLPVEGGYTLAFTKKFHLDEDSNFEKYIADDDAVWTYFDSMTPEEVLMGEGHLVKVCSPISPLRFDNNDAYAKYVQENAAMNMKVGRLYWINVSTGEQGDSIDKTPQCLYYTSEWRYVPSDVAKATHRQWGILQDVVDDWRKKNPRNLYGVGTAVNTQQQPENKEDEERRKALEEQQAAEAQAASVELNNEDLKKLLNQTEESIVNPPVENVL